MPRFLTNIELRYSVADWELTNIPMVLSVDGYIQSISGHGVDHDNVNRWIPADWIPVENQLRRDPTYMKWSKFTPAFQHVQVYGEPDRGSLPPPPDAAIAAGGVRAPPPPAPAPPPPAGAGGRGAGPSSDAAAATYQPVRTAAPTTRPPASSASRRAAGSPLSAGASHPRPPPHPAQPPSPPRPIISPLPAGLTSPVPAPEPATPSPTPHRRSALFAAAAAPLSAPYRSATTRRALLHPTPLRSRLQHRPTPLCCSAAPLSATNILHVTTPFDSVSSLSFAAATPTGREVGGGAGGGGLGGGRRRCLA